MIDRQASAQDHVELAPLHPNRDAEALLRVDEALLRLGLGQLRALELERNGIRTDSVVMAASVGSTRAAFAIAKSSTWSSVTR